jgi:DeoR/GlpR family transcriptional regulator of sugar metabolism
MIKAEREARILSILNEVGIASIRDLVGRLGRASAVTVRRDVARLAERGALVRSHGGVARLPAAAKGPVAPAEGGGEAHLPIEKADAIVLPPLQGRSADTLRLMAQRRRIPFLAESSPQAGGTYLGPDNMAAGRELGRIAADRLRATIESAKILLISLEELPNTRARCEGFLDGFRELFRGTVRHWRVDGRGVFKTALRASLDALQAHADINIVFGVNDHSVLAAIEAAERLRRSGVYAFSVGGEGSALFDMLAAKGKLVACAALFPEIVGARAIDVLSQALLAEPLPAEVRTPHAILTAETLGDFYRRDETGWSLLPAAAVRLGSGSPALPKAAGRLRRGTIGFIPHYPAHDWYRNMRRSMEMRAAELGLEVIVDAPQLGIAREIRALRKLIARAAAGMISPGDTVLLNQGEASLLLADELVSSHDVTVVTNSLDVLERLSGRPGLKVLLTSGELQAAQRCLVGPSLGALFETLRVDKAFLAVDGISARFGPSFRDERLALVARRFAEASREVYVLADHSLVGHDASHRVVAPDRVDEIVTDSGSLPADRLAFTSAGTRITLADEEEERPAPRRAGALPDETQPGIL